MKQKIMLVCLALLLCFSVAMGEETIAPPQEDGLVELTEEDLLEKMAEEEQGDGFVVLPEESELDIRSTYNLLLIGTDAYTDDSRGRSDTTVLVQLDTDQKNGEDGLFSAGHVRQNSREGEQPHQCQLCLGRRGTAGENPGGKLWRNGGCVCGRKL